jgi:hypothetical protein
MPNRKYNKMGRQAIAMVYSINLKTPKKKRLAAGPRQQAFEQR